MPSLRESYLALQITMQIKEHASLKAFHTLVSSRLAPT
ncbi:UDP-N-acetylenolpyruvoylglucosamine reductase 2 domain protein [Vibrio parahaemolyticus NIHCB0603]|nr:UDP-N-acetylenolpyruvoylglucosamine reductase 2 domain protein [Vibrio parahaemolyticus NIHCB0603]